MKRLTVSLIIILLVLAGLYLLMPFFLNGLAGHLIVRDRLDRADAILVLAGDNNGERVDEGVNLYKQGYAGYILMSGGPLAWRLTNAEWMKKQALAEGVPDRAIILQARSRSTLDDANFSLPIAVKHNFKSVILVTSPYHTRRAAVVFKKIFGSAGIKVIVYPVRKSDFNPVGWWTRHEDAAAVVWEYVARIMYLLKGY
ncbi:MAG: YdcF family protein [Candidatus Margulisbacteria bacterium]|nr:YdcF family protein [Candidatus Margulisiibacteriota bacterium]